MATTCEIISEVGKVGKLDVTICDWNNRGEKVDIREWYTNDDGETKPGRGITIKKEQIDTMIKLLQEAKEQMK